MKRSRRLYLHMYVALLASALLCLAVAAFAFRSLRDAGGPPRERMRRAAVMLPERLPDARAADARARLAQIADDFGVDIVVGDDTGPFVGVPSTDAVPVPRRPVPGWRRDRSGPVMVTPLDGDVWAAMRPHGRQLRVNPFFATLAILAVVMAVGSYPVARWVTRRLETLAQGVERWGKGDLGHRVAVSGSDEIATLATTFNQAAERLDLLISQQREMLANASHEMRSPLTRLRMGLELIAEEPDESRRRGMVDRIHRDIVELDGLIEDVLLFARADTRVPRRPLGPVDMRALLAEEAERTDATVEGDARPAITGDGALLRHLVRNLLENARQHGGGGPVRAVLAMDGSTVRLVVEDQGPGVPEPDREHIFAPFFRGASTTGTTSTTGHGLGLALVRQVARYHGGDVVFQPRPEGGSRFEVTLPLDPPTSGSETPPPRRPGS